MSDIGMEACLAGLAKRGYLPECVLDIGASDGCWTRLALRHWRKAHYFLIEVLEEQRRHLQSLKKSAPSIDFLIAGVGDQPGQLTLSIDPAHPEISSFAYAMQESRLVEVTTIDELRRQNRFPQPSFVKIDVQGFELNVLAGARETMPGCDLILLELQFFRFSPQMKLLHESIQWMAQHNFVPYEIVDTMRRPLDGAMGQCDLLFAREDHWLRRDQSWG